VEQLHLVLGWIAVAGAIGLFVTAAVTATAVTRSYLLLDRGILAQIVTMSAAIVSGLVVLPTHGGPADPLHFVYAVAGLLVAPVVRYATRNAAPSRMGRWQLVAAFVVLGVVLRLFMTGR
jgi:hypothetical protein